MPREADLAYWINTREYVRFHKEANEPRPWTTDPILQKYRFCNVRREDDKVTRWVRRNWSDRYGGNHPNVLLAMTMARFVNRIESLEALGYPQHGLDQPSFHIVAEGRKPFWGNAYTISTCGARMAKPDYVAGVLATVEKLQPEFHYMCSVRHSCEEAHMHLMRINGLGSFLAAQIVADLKWTPGHPLETARDRATWAAPGPGSQRGLDRFYRRRQGTVGWLGMLQHAAELTAPLINSYLWEHNLHKMDMQDWQNCMCEFDKYLRIKEDKGHVRNTYPGTP